MELYFFNIIFICIVSFIVYSLNYKRELFLVLSFLYLFLVSSLRDGTIGTDYKSYIIAFETISKTGTYYMEKGYVLLNRIVSFVTSNYIGIAFSVNIILFFSLFFYVRNNVDSDYWWICVLVFVLNPYMFIQSTFNLMRQTCATGILLIGMNCIINKLNIRRLVVYCSLVLIAAQFHRIAYFMLLIPIVLWFPWRRSYWLIVLFISLLISFIGINRILDFLIGNLDFRNSYANYEPSLLNNPLYLALIIILVLFILYRYPIYVEFGEKERRIINLFLFSLCFLLFAVSNDMVYRIYIMLAYCSLPGFGILIKRANSNTCFEVVKNEAIVLKIVILFYFLFFYIGYIVLLSYNKNVYYVPFKFVF